jgi:hypothetical protein
VEGYPRLQKTQRMLAVLNRALTEAERAGEPGLMVMISRGGGTEAGVYLDNTERINLAEELGFGGGETVSLFRWAEAAGYMRPGYGSGGREADTPIAFLEYLEPEGYALIGELPDPQEKLILGLDAAIRAIQQDPTMDPGEKQRKIDWFEEFKIVARTLTIDTAKAVLRGDIQPM